MKTTYTVLIAERKELQELVKELSEALEIALLLFSKDHALDRFNWGASGLRAQDIRELNELPLKIRGALAKAHGEKL